MPVPVISCITIDVPEPPPHLTIPHFGEFAPIWDAIHAIPSPEQLICKLQGIIANALAPIKRYLELVEIILSFKKCLEAIPDAITSMSPTPIYDCFKEQAKTIARILSWIPPFAYFVLMREILHYCVLLIDEIFAILTTLDRIMADYVAAIARGTAINDRELVRIANCGITDVRLRVRNVLAMIKMIKPIVDILLGVFIRLLPGGPGLSTIKKFGEALEQADSDVNDINAAVEGGSTSTLQPLVEILNSLRSGLIMAREIFTALSGADPTHIWGRTLKAGSAAPLTDAQMPHLVYL